MINDSISNHFIENKKEFREFSDKAEFLHRLADKFEIAHITYFCLGSDLQDHQDGRLLTTYSGDWKEHYFSMNYGETDPVIMAGMRGFLPVDWSLIPKTGKSAHRFFGEAQEFGISPRGLTVPVRGSKGETALLSVNSHLPAADWISYKKCHISDITYFAHLLHHEILETFTQNDSGKAVKLTPRERQVLVWASQGKTCWETAKILKLAERTVNFYLRNATHKLNAVTKTQAVATAIAENHIIVDALPKPTDVQNKPF